MEELLALHDVLTPNRYVDMIAIVEDMTAMTKKHHQQNEQYDDIRLAIDIVSKVLSERLQ